MQSNKFTIRREPTMSHKTLRMMLLSALFAALTAVGAFIRLPAGPTSITLQFFFSALAGILLGGEVGRGFSAAVCGAGTAGASCFHHGRRSFLFAPAQLPIPAGADPLHGCYCRPDASLRQPSPPVSGMPAGRSGSVSLRRSLYVPDLPMFTAAPPPRGWQCGPVCWCLCRAISSSWWC